MLFYQDYPFLLSYLRGFDDLLRLTVQVKVKQRMEELTEIKNDYIFDQVRNERKELDKKLIQVQKAFAFEWKQILVVLIRILMYIY